MNLLKFRQRGIYIHPKENLSNSLFKPFFAKYSGTSACKFDWYVPVRAEYLRNCDKISSSSNIKYGISKEFLILGTSGMASWRMLCLYFQIQSISLVRPLWLQSLELNIVCSQLFLNKYCALDWVILNQHCCYGLPKKDYINWEGCLLALPRCSASNASSFSSFFIIAPAVLLSTAAINVLTAKVG